MNTQRMIRLIISTAVCGLFSCNKVNFSQVEQDSQQAATLPPIVVDPGPVVPPVPPVVPVVPPVTPPLAKLSSGDCAADSSSQLLSCLKCVVPANPTPPPQFSEKGQSLLEGLALACQIRNGSDPSGYVPPTHAQLLARLNKASPTFYPDTTMTAQQISVVNGLKDPNNDSMRRRLMGGMWYQPPYSDAFETYFGLSVAEARYTFCYDSPSAVFTMYNTSTLHSKAYIDCTYNFSNCAESPAYVSGNTYRGQLRTTMQESVLRPYEAPPALPAKVCKWEKYEGEYDEVAHGKIREWLGKGLSLGMSVETLAGRCEAVTGVDSALRGKVTISGYSCK